MYHSGFLTGIAPKLSKLIGAASLVLIISSLILASGITVYAQSPTIPQQSQSSGLIYGRIISSADQAPISGAKIEAMLVSGGQYFQKNVESQADGRYSFENIPHGYYALSVAAPGYIREYDQGTYNANDESARIYVSDSQNTSNNINFALELGGRITGHIYQANGDTPVQGAEIKASLYRDFPYNESTQSGEDGSYTISGLPTGNYVLGVQAEGFIIQYYGDGTGYDASQKVKIAAPEATSSVDFNLRKGGWISGQVLTPQGAPIAGARIIANSSSPYERETHSAVDGRYTVGGLIAGQYTVSVFVQGHPVKYYPNAADGKSATPVYVTEFQNAAGINFILDGFKYGSISGKVRQSDGETPLPGVRIIALPQGVYSSFTQSDVFSDVAGSFTGAGLPAGSYIFQALAGDAGYISEYYGNSFNLNTASAVKVVEGKTTPNIDFVLEKGGSISGRVTQADGVTPIAGIDIALFSQPDYTSSARSFRTDASGYYHFSGLPAASYTLLATVPDYLNYLGEYYDEVPVSNFIVATPVKVTPPQEVAGINFTLDKAQPGATSAQQNIIHESNQTGTVDLDTENIAPALPDQSEITETLLAKFSNPGYGTRSAFIYWAVAAAVVICALILGIMIYRRVSRKS